MTKALANLDAADRALAKAESLEEIEDIRDIAIAAEAYARARRYGLEWINKAVAVRLKASRKGGEKLAAMEKAKPGGDMKSDHRGSAPPDGPPSLSQLGIDKDTAKEFRAAHKVPAEEFRTYVGRAKEVGRRVTVKGVFQLARAADRAKRAAARPGPLPPQLIRGDFRQHPAAACSVDLVLTDPPYDEESVGLYGELSAWAERALRPGGLCFAYSGQSFVTEALIGLSEHLDFMWLFAVRHTGGELRFRKYQLRNAWKPILAFYKPPLDPWWDWASDVVEGGGKEKQDHDWGQAEAEAAYLIAAFCPGSGMVADPMCGGGTALVAAKKLGRTYLGIDIDQVALQSAAKRLNVSES